MADVFISYASEDRQRAAKLAGALSAHGWSVWWDRKIIAGQAFDVAIERELENAGAVVVLWSKHSVESEWVKNEASVAAERGTLVPAFIDEVKLPLEFRRRQTADLTGWRGDPAHGGFRSLCEGVAALAGREARAPSVSAGNAPSRRSSRWALTALAAVVLVLGGTFYAFWSGQSLGRNSGGGDSGASGGELASLVAGTFHGEVISDSKAASRSDVTIKVDRIESKKVRITSDDPRFGVLDIALTRVGNTILNSGGGTPFTADLERKPMAVAVDPRGEIAYRGTKQHSRATSQDPSRPKALRLTATTKDEADQVEIRTSPSDGLGGRVRVCLQVKTASGWWKGIGLNESSPTLAGQKSDGLKCTTIAAGLIDVAYWKAKALGIQTSVGSGRLDLRPYGDHEVVFTWKTD